MLEYLLEVKSIDVIAGNVNYDLSKVSSNKLLGHIIGYTQVVNEPRHTSGSHCRKMKLISLLVNKNWCQMLLGKY